ncbi:MAG TPA: tRNA lysidine(34) synthetase TilS [Bryobacteraceae bacterium]|nr:tRNA lysidine(34) synthetase TilS [Bryobacteraceae bacterium]
MNLLGRISETVSRHRMLAPGQRVGVAVSGGADSVCLLDALRELAKDAGWSLSVLHLDHGLRGGESRADAAFVAELAARLGLPFYLETVDVRALAAGGNLEQAGRDVRYAFFRRLIADGTVDRVALGHTRSDQAETVLYRFLRGAGTAGLAGIRPVTAEGIVRPLLDLERGDVVAWLAERGLAWREDASNADLSFDRNRIRHQLLPALVREWNPGLTRTLANLADRAREEEAWWEVEIDRLAAERLTLKPPAVLLEAGPLAEMPPAFARRLVRRAIEIAKGDLRGIDFEHVSAVLAMAAAPEGHGRMQVPGLDVFRSFEWLRLAPPAAGTPRDFRLPVAPPAGVKLPDGSEISLEVLETPQHPGMFDSVYNDGVGCLDWHRVSGPLEFRNWIPGDRYQPAGHPGESKVKTLFQDARIPLWERRHWPVLTSGDAIIWVRRFGPAAEYAAGPGSRTVLRIRDFAG